MTPAEVRAIVREELQAAERQPVVDVAEALRHGIERANQVLKDDARALDVVAQQIDGLRHQSLQIVRRALGHDASPSSSGRTDEDGAAGAPDAPAAPGRGQA